MFLALVNLFEWPALLVRGFEPDLRVLYPLAQSAAVLTRRPLRAEVFMEVV